MTDNEIIKGLECLAGKNVSCTDCAYFGEYRLSNCKNYVTIDALNLIFELKAEIDKLKGYKNLYEDLKTENLETIKSIKTVETKAIKEFVKKFEKNIKDVNFTLGQTWDIQTALEKTSKEMTEERK